MKIVEEPSFRGANIQANKHSNAWPPQKQHLINIVSAFKMLRMIHQSQPFSKTRRKNKKNASLIFTKYMIDEFPGKLKYIWKSEHWALFALVAIISCNISVVLWAMASKNVFSKDISKPLNIACPLLIVFSIVNIIISWYTYIKKKKHLYRNRQENNREYIKALIFAEDKMHTRNACRESHAKNDYHVIAQEIQPGMILGKVVTERGQNDLEDLSRECV